jgi:hypothetical protein
MEFKVLVFNGLNPPLLKVRFVLDIVNSALLANPVYPQLLLSHQVFETSNNITFIKNGYFR